MMLIIKIKHDCNNKKPYVNHDYRQQQKTSRQLWTENFMLIANKSSQKTAQKTTTDGEQTKPFSFGESYSSSALQKQPSQTLF